MEKEPHSLVRFLVGEKPGNVPWFQRFFLKFFFAKERASRGAARGERKTFFSLSLFAASRLAPSFAKKNFKKNVWDQGTGNKIEREISRGQDKPFLAQAANQNSEFASPCYLA